jgi:hypothetical protein
MATKTRPAETPATEALVETTQRPNEPSADELALAQAQSTTTAVAGGGLDRPTMEPPTSSAGAAASAGAGWLTNKHVLMLWQSSAPMNGWCYLDGGVGWKQLTQAGETAARGMGVLAAGARCGNGLVHAYEGTSSGVIDAFYLW